MLERPKCIEQGYAYIDDETEKWVLKEDSPDWAVKECNEFFGLLASQPDDNDITTKY